MKYAILKVQVRDFKNLKWITKYQIAREEVSVIESTERVSVFKEIHRIKETYKLSSSVLRPFNGCLPSFETYKEAQKYIDFLVSKNPSDNSQIVYQVEIK